MKMNEPEFEIIKFTEDIITTSTDSSMIAGYKGNPVDDTTGKSQTQDYSGLKWGNTVQ